MPADNDTDPLAAALVDFFAQKHRERIVAGYELYLLAARRPGLRPAVDLWLTVLADLPGRHTTIASACACASRPSTATSCNVSAPASTPSPTTWPRCCVLH